MLAANIPFRIYAEGIYSGLCSAGTRTLSGPAQSIRPAIGYRREPAGGERAHLALLLSSPPIWQTEPCPHSTSSPDVDDDAHNGTAQQADLGCRRMSSSRYPTIPHSHPEATAFLSWSSTKQRRRHRARRRPCLPRSLGTNRKGWLHADIERRSISTRACCVPSWNYSACRTLQARRRPRLPCRSSSFRSKSAK